MESNEGASELSAAEAQAAIARLERFDGAIRTRVEGITWVVWGLVSSAVFLSYDWAGAVLEEDAPSSSSPAPWRRRRSVG